MQHSVRDYLMQRFRWICDRFNPLRSAALNPANDLFRYHPGLLEEIVRTPFNANWIADQRVSGPFIVASLIPVYFDSTALWKDCLRQISEKNNSTTVGLSSLISSCFRSHASGSEVGTTSR